MKNVNVCGHSKNLTYTGALNRNIRISKHGDADRDGVPNHKDCRPFDPKRQGWLHDQKMKRLKKQEEHYEKKREKEQKKLEDINDELKLRNKISSAKLGKKRLIMKEKQARIDEITREKKKIQEIKDANRKAKLEIEKYSAWGKIKRGTEAAGRGLSKIAVSSAKALKDADNALSHSRRANVRKPRIKKSSSKRKKKEDGFGW